MPYHARVVNMIPKSRSAETHQDSEPSITVDPANPDVIVGTAFTPDPSGGPNAPFYISTDRGDTWALNPVLPNGNSFSGTGDVTMTFDGSGHDLYAGQLIGAGFLDMSVDRTTSPTSGTTMTVLEARGNIDQPFAKATTVRHGIDAGKDRLYVGNNDFSSPSGRTSTIDVSLDAGITAPVFKSVRIDSRATPGQDGPQVRSAIHSDGTVYAAFYGWRAQGATITTDVVVVRDDDWGSGAAPFTDLTDPGDGKPGLRVAQGVTIIFNDFLGQERQAGNLASAVDPRDSSRVYVAWCDGTIASGTYTMHVRRSDDRGNTWSNDLFTIPNATNVGLAVNEHGHVGLLYQRLTGTPGSQRWENHVQHSTDHGHHWHDTLLATVPANTPPKTFDPYIGDYAMMVSRGADFYGIFCANNTPDLANFPHGVRYQRNVDFATQQLLDLGGNPVAISIDPFFFHLHWHEEERREEELQEAGERVVIKGLRYERLEIEHLVIERPRK
jgi:hypothetical protein